MNQPLRIALSKGRILEQTLPLFEAIGVTLQPGELESRKLILQTLDQQVQFIIIRATDVPTYVEYGAADMGVVGKDVLVEYGQSSFYELLDLNIARCKLMVARLKSGQERSAGRPRVATKYVNIARDYFARQGVQVELVKLYGSMELAPLVGLADYIVDLVETGGTLRANGLEATETVLEVSSRLIVNKAAMKVRHQQLMAMVDRLTAQLNGRLAG
ncbi:MAG TPA: ATP phosphoribosyltransferase [Gammaproteobacteria bacterium]|nr:ATP phosphoribosyltransferase [Gammaproteobacteria bacterium]